jgi:hypothetical protein
MKYVHDGSNESHKYHKLKENQMMLTLGLLLLLGTAYAGVTPIFIFTDESAGTESIDSDHSSFWYVNVIGTEILFGGAELTMKKGNLAEASIFMTVYAGWDPIPANVVTFIEIAADDPLITKQLTQIPFNLAPQLSYSTGDKFCVFVTSTAGTTGAKRYSITDKDKTQSYISVSYGGPADSSTEMLRTISMSPTTLSTTTTPTVATMTPTAATMTPTVATMTPTMTTIAPTNPTSAPTNTPTVPSNSPTTATPTTPTTPTNRPLTRRPTHFEPPPCVEPGTVTCCFTARQTILNVYIDGFDVTGQVQGDLTDPMEGKTITFPEPAVRDVALAFKTEEREQGLMGSLMAQCTSDRAASPWNNMNTADPGAWLGVWIKKDGTCLHSDWYKNYYKWEKPNNGIKAVDDSYSLKTNTCGAVTSTDKVSTRMRRAKIPFLAMRIVVNNLNAPEFCKDRRRALRVLKSEDE